MQAAEVYIWVVLFMRCTIYLFSTYSINVNLYIYLLQRLYFVMNLKLSGL